MSRFGLQIAAHLNSDENQRRNAELAYQHSVEAARDYDGSEASEQNVYSMIHAFEACAREIADHQVIDVTNPSLRDELELAVAHAVASDLPTLSVDGLLGLAIESFGRKLDAGTADLLTIETGLHFLPTFGTTNIVPSDEPDAVWDIRVEPRTAQLIQALNRNGIYTDDIVVFKGVNVPRVMRQRPYTLIQIPRLDREVLICDEVQQATFIGIGQREPTYWATHSKEQLSQEIGIIRITKRGDWVQKIIQLLFDTNPPGPKTKLAARLYQKSKLQLTEDLILNKALEYAMAHAGALPDKNSGEVDGFPGENWYNWGISVRNYSNGLTREGLTGLPGLFRLYGLMTIGISKNPVAIAKACETLRKTGSHGLVEVKEMLLTEDLILQKAVEYATMHGGRLPTKTSGEVDGLPGQYWINWDGFLIRRFHGLKGKDAGGLAELFRAYGLKIAKTANPEAIRQAAASLAATGAHGLKQGDKMTLSEDLILRKALEFAEKHNGKLPTKHSGEVDGLPGQRWDRWNECLRNKSNGLTRDDVAGLPVLFHLYGLKIGRVENHVAVQKAIKTLNETGKHGLQMDAVMQLNDDLILHKAIEFAIDHKGRLPTPLDGEIKGYPGQRWSNWHAAIHRNTSGLMLDGLSGLPDLLRAYGLKHGRKTNLPLVKQAWERLQTNGHHGLCIDERLVTAPTRPIASQAKGSDDEPSC
jgi:hypothetical protein